MKIVLPVAVMYILALALILGGAEAFNPYPCQRNFDNNAYNNFARKHILQSSFNTGSESEWERYLRNKGLCHRPRQSFMRKSDEGLVIWTCNGYGRRLRNNLCTSTSDMMVYDFRVDTNTCKVTNLRRVRRYVILACDEIDSDCRPVHYQGSSNRPPNGGVICH